MAIMKRLPWLVIGTVVGSIVGCNAFTGYFHGPDDKELILVRILYGAGVGSTIGLMTDMILAVRRRR